MSSLYLYRCLCCTCYFSILTKHFFKNYMLEPEISSYSLHNACSLSKTCSSTMILNPLTADELGEGALDMVQPCLFLANMKAPMATPRAAFTRHHNTKKTVEILTQIFTPRKGRQKGTHSQTCTCQEHNTWPQYKHKPIGQYLLKSNLA